MYRGGNDRILSIKVEDLLEPLDFVGWEKTSFSRELGKEGISSRESS